MVVDKRCLAKSACTEIRKTRIYVFPEINKRLPSFPNEI